MARAPVNNKRTGSKKLLTIPARAGRRLRRVPRSPCVCSPGGRRRSRAPIPCTSLIAPRSCFGWENPWGANEGRRAKPARPTGPARNAGIDERGVSRLFFDALNDEILQGLIPAQHGIHPGFGKIPRPEAAKRVAQKDFAEVADGERNPPFVLRKPQPPRSTAPPVGRTGYGCNPSKTGSSASSWVRAGRDRAGHQTHQPQTCALRLRGRSL